MEGRSMQLGRLTGRQKAAVVLISLGPDLSSRVFKYLGDDEIEDLTFEIASQRTVPPEVKKQVLSEFYEMSKAHEYMAQGGIEYAREVLSKALGEEQAESILGKLTSSLNIRPFEFARRTDPAHLFNFIQNEHPQTIALVLAHLNPEQAGAILSALPAERQVDVAKRIATLDRASPDVLEEIESALEHKLSSFGTYDYMSAGGLEAVVEILNRVDRSTEKTILESLEEDDPELADEIKTRMFVFEDIVLLDDRSIQQVIREVDTDVWALALKTASEEVARRVYRNMSKRAAEMLREDIEYMGPVRLRDVEEAQSKVVATIRELEEAGEVIIARGGEDEIIV